MFKAVRTGIDLCRISRMAELQENEAFLRRVLSEDEIAYFQGKGVMAAQRAFERAGMLRTKLKLYDGMRHEILNEPGHAQVYADILQWIEGIEGEKQN